MPEFKWRKTTGHESDEMWECKINHVKMVWILGVAEIKEPVYTWLWSVVGVPHPPEADFKDEAQLGTSTHLKDAKAMAERWYYILNKRK